MRRRVKSFELRYPADVKAVKFVARDFIMFEPEVHRYPGAGSDRDDQGGFVFHGTDDKVYDVKDGDYVVFVGGRVFPSYAALDRNHSFVMDGSTFEELFIAAGGTRPDEDEGIDEDEDEDIEE